VEALWKHTVPGQQCGDEATGKPGEAVAVEGNRLRPELV